MVTGIVGLVFLCAWGLGTILSVVALVLGIMARNRLSAPGAQAQGKGMAVAGIVMGAIGVAIGVIVIVLIIIAAVSTPSTTYYG
jgi:hypothetical protein